MTHHFMRVRIGAYASGFLVAASVFVILFSAGIFLLFEGDDVDRANGSLVQLCAASGLLAMWGGRLTKHHLERRAGREDQARLEVSRLE